MWDRGYDQMVAEIKARFGFELESSTTPAGGAWSTRHGWRATP